MNNITRLEAGNPHIDNIHLSNLACKPPIPNLQTLHENNNTV